MRVAILTHLSAAAFLHGCVAASEPEPSPSGHTELAASTAALSVGATGPEFATLVGNFDQDAYKELAVVSSPFGVPTLRIYNVTAAGRTALSQELALPWARGSVQLLAASGIVAVGNGGIDQIVVAAGGGGLGHPPTLRVYSGGVNGTTLSQVATIPAITTERCAGQDCRPSIAKHDQSIILSYRDESVIHVRQYDYSCLTAERLMTPAAHLELPTACPGNVPERIMPDPCDPQLASGSLCGPRQDIALAYSDGRGNPATLTLHMFKREAGNAQSPYPHLVQYDQTTYEMEERGIWWRLIGYGNGARQALSLAYGDQTGVAFNSMTCANNHVAPGADANALSVYGLMSHKGTASAATMYSGSVIGAGGQALVTYSNDVGASGEAALIAPRVGFGPPNAPTIERRVPFDPLTQFVVAGNFYGTVYDEIVVLAWRGENPPTTVALPGVATTTGSTQQILKRKTGTRFFTTKLAPSRSVGVRGVRFTAPAGWPAACRVSVYYEDMGIPLAGAVLAAGVVNRTTFASAKLGGNWHATIVGCRPPAATTNLTLQFDWRNP